MIRPFTCVCMLLAAGSGLYLYQTKHRAQMLDREIQRTVKQTEGIRDRLGVLRGEWALLGEPERLSELSAQHLTLKTLDPKQFVSFVDLNSRLPAPMPAGTVQMPVEEQTPEAAPVAVAKPAPAARIAATAPSIPPTKPVQVATLVPPTVTPPPSPPPNVLPAATPPMKTPPVQARSAPTVTAPPLALAPTPVPRIMAPVVSVSSAPIPAPSVPAPARVQGLAAPSPTSIGESVARAARNAAPAREPADRIVQASAAASSYAPAFARAPAFSSALGGSRSALPAPVPYGVPQVIR